MKYTEQFGDST